MAYEKLYNEIYAITALKYLWQGYAPGFVKGESPDWRNDVAGIGIEVSQALLPRDGQEESFLEAYLGCLRREIPEDAFSRFGERLYFYNDRLWALLDDGVNDVGGAEKIIFRFRRKLLKLNTNYRCCNTNGLYLFVHQPLPLSGAEELCRTLAALQARSCCRFKLVFLDTETEIYCLNLQKETVELIPVPAKAQLFLKEKAEALRNEAPWPDGRIYE